MTELNEEVEYQEAATTMRVKAAMSNKFLMGKFVKKRNRVATVVGDYLLVGGIKDLESEEKKEDALGCYVSTAYSALPSLGLGGATDGVEWPRELWK